MLKYISIILLVFTTNIVFSQVGIGTTVTLTDSDTDNIVKDSDTVTITATFNKAMANTPTITIGGVQTAVEMTATATNTTWTYLWNVPAGNDGTVSVTVSGTDIAGNAYNGAVNNSPAVVGDFRDGGVVFHLFVDGETGYVEGETHGLICAIEDQSTAVAWQADYIARDDYMESLYEVTGATGTAIGTGSTNTTTIIGVLDDIGERPYAAGIARAYNGGGFNDWFLPSKEELSKMRGKREIINTTAAENGGSDFVSELYWSSTEVNQDLAYRRYTYGSNYEEYYKSTDSYVRAIRAFTGTGTDSITFTIANQLDTDGDGVGDVSDTDDDGDGVADTDDAFPLDATESADTDGDGVGDNADTDLDNDGILDTVDNCLYTPNADQLDTDADGIGNACDTDDDGDGFSDADEITCGTDPLLASSKPLDTDNDGIANCIDTDDDGDGYLDTDEITCGSDPLDATSTPLDTDNDGIANCIDTDDDNDSYLDVNDAFPLDNTEWLDTDSDGIGNNADTDDDGDGQLDTDEIACGSDPLLASSISLDTDGDTIPDCVDTDDDNDGVEDTSDAFPLDPAEWADTDADGIGNNADNDDDNDGQSDYNELVCGSDPLDKNSKSSDIDSDSIPDCVDEDKDGDGVLNDQDAFPEDSSESVDTDGDGLGDNFEVDDDNDGYLDTNDAFPLDPNEWADADNDGIGDNADTDDNNDGFEDDKLFSSGVLTPGSGGLEDTWKIINIEQFPINRVSVYDKNGNVVFTTANYKNNWRGTFNNSANPLPAGSYYYVVDLNNGQDQIKGWLYIMY